MSKLEDKLAASIKPDRPEQAAPKGATPAPRSKPRKPAPKPAARGGDAADDLNAPGTVLHPTRIWPD